MCIRDSVITGDEEARGGVRIAIAEGEIFTFGDQIVQVIDRAVFVDDQHAPVARRSICGDGLGKYLTVSAIHGFHRREVAAVSYTHLRAHETKANLVCRLLLEKKK